MASSTDTSSSANDYETYVCDFLLNKVPEDKVMRVPQWRSERVSIHARAVVNLF